jgi:TetR/AcrR family transcriptional repressor of bet genes
MASPEPRFRRYTPEVRATMLVDAGLACLGRGGITAFTVDNICREAGASRGLIAHHFGSKDGLLAQVYAAAYRPMLESLTADPEHPLPLGELIGRMISAEKFNRESLNIWLALWGEVATNPALQAEHRKHYGTYRATVAGAITDLARQKGIDIDAEELAISLISLIDGLWLEQCIDPDLLTPERARSACLRLLEAVLGPV